MEISERIKKRRKELGLTLKVVAEKLGVSESLISRYESKDVKNMGIDKVKPLADILQTTPSYLMGWEENLNKDYIDHAIKTNNLKHVLDSVPLTIEEKIEFEKIKQMNMFMFNGKEVSEANVEKLNNVLKEIFIESLIEKRKKETK